jgi:hypothetical protein
MYQEALVEKRIDDGKRLLEALDRAGLKPRAALWYFNSEMDRWRLAISLPIVDAAGHQKAYEKIRAVLLQLKPRPEFSLSDITVQSSHSNLIGTVRTAAGSGPEGFTFIGQPVDSGFIEETYIYRI